MNCNYEAKEYDESELEEMNNRDPEVTDTLQKSLIGLGKHIA